MGMNDKLGRGGQNLPDDSNPFATMGMVKFWIISTVFYLTFPASLAISYLAFGPHRTKQLIRALINDFLQTILIFLVILVLIIWAAFHFLAPLFGG